MATMVGKSSSVARRWRKAVVMSENGEGVFLKRVRGARRTQRRAEDFFYAQAGALAAFVFREVHAYALRLVVMRAGRRDPGDLAGDRVFVDVVHQRQDQV